MTTTIKCFIKLADVEMDEVGSKLTPQAPNQSQEQKPTTTPPAGRKKSAHYTSYFKAAFLGSLSRPASNGDHP